jgi:hypothetical protein
MEELGGSRRLAFAVWMKQVRLCMEMVLLLLLTAELIFVLFRFY